MSDDKPEIDTSFGLPPTPEQRAEARTVLPMPPAHVRTLYDNLPEGVSEANPAPQPVLNYPDPWVPIKAPEETLLSHVPMHRVGLGDEPWLGWVVARLAEHYPMVQATSWVQWLRAFMGARQTYFMRTERACVAATAMISPLTAEVYVQPVFVLHMDTGPEGGSIRGSEGEKEATQLVRDLRNWAKLQRAVGVRRLMEFSDLPASVYIKELKAERREEVWIALK